jgi:hypothetical protein
MNRYSNPRTQPFPTSVRRVTESEFIALVRDYFSPAAERQREFLRQQNINRTLQSLLQLATRGRV